jgi:riboflavin synthase
MFTGLIQDIGTVEQIIHGDSTDLWIATSLPNQDLATGGSIAVDGACLTMVELAANRFRIQASPETLRRTTLGSLKPGSSVNLELPLRVGDQLGGHWVLGHVDSVSSVLERKPAGAALAIRFALPEPVTAFFVEKGSVAIDGISLTVNEMIGDSFWVMLIPETLRRTYLGTKQAGQLVNLEADLIGKYVARLYALRGSPSSA